MIDTPEEERRALRRSLGAAVLLLFALVVGIDLWATRDLPGVTRWTQVAFVWQPDRLTPAPPANGWVPVTLPVRWQGRVEGDPHARGQWWYRTTLEPKLTAQALYVPRITGSAVRVLTRAPGEPWRVAWDGNAHESDQWNRPVLVPLGDASHGLELAVSLTHDMDAGHRMTAWRTGPLAVLQGRNDVRELLQIELPRVGSLTFLILGLAALMHWVRQPRQRAYLLFALMSGAWALRNLHFHVPQPQGATANAWYWWLTNASLTWVMVLVFLFTLRFAQRRSPQVEAALSVFAVVATLLAMPFWQPGVPLMQMHVLSAVVAFSMTAWLLWLARFSGREMLAVTGSLVVADLCGVHDLIMATGGVTLLEHIYLLPVGMLCGLMAYLYAAQQRYTQALGTAEQANAQLAERLAEREAELRAGHERLRAVERDQTLLLERQRLMRDMHDGLGSTLMSSLALAERGRLASGDVSALLRDCVDDLRMVIDSLEPIGHDLVTLLAALRYRLGPRLEGAGLRIEWAVEDVPPLPWLGPHEALQVLRSVQEVLTNVLKHARAQRVRMAVALHDEAIWVEIEDDGQGFDAAATREGRGLRHLRERAAQWGGAVEVQSRAGSGTAVRLVLPLARG